MQRAVWKGNFAATIGNIITGLGKRSVAGHKAKLATVLGMDSSEAHCCERFCVSMHRGLNLLVICPCEAGCRNGATKTASTSGAPLGFSGLWGSHTERNAGE